MWIIAPHRRQAMRTPVPVCDVANPMFVNITLAGRDRRMQTLDGLGFFSLDLDLLAVNVVQLSCAPRAKTPLLNPTNGVFRRPPLPDSSESICGLMGGTGIIDSSPVCQKAD